MPCRESAWSGSFWFVRVCLLELPLLLGRDLLWTCHMLESYLPVTVLVSWLFWLIFFFWFRLIQRWSSFGVRGPLCLHGFA